MKKLMLFFCFLFILTFFVNADTHIPSGDVSGTWTLANSPYIIDGRITIQSGDELTIEPGVHVVFSDHYRFTIEGRMVSVGTDSDSIFFYPQAVEDGWSGLRFYDGNSNGQDDSEIAYCVIKDGKANGVDPFNRGGGIYLTNTTLSVQNTTIKNNEAYGIGGGIFCSASSLTLQNVNIENNSAGNGEGGGIYCWEAEIIISDSEIQHNDTSVGGGAGIYLGENSTATISRTAIHNNEAYSWGGGIRLDSSTLNANKLTIYGNNASYSGGGINLNSTSTVDIVNSIIWNNSPDQINESTRSLSVSYSDVFSPTAPWPGEGNILSDPLFVDSDNEDFHLTIESPCIDSGDPNSATDDDGTRADMGAYYYHHDGTLVPAGIVSGTWNTAGSPYYILGDIEIPQYGNETSLTIDAGVEVIFMGHYKFIINGQLLANGEDNNMITFTINDTTGFYQYPDSPDGGWHGLRFMGGRGTRSASSLSFCDISFGKAIGDYDDANGGAIYMQYNAEVNLSSSNIYNNIAAGNGGAISCQYGWSDITLFDNLIFNNQSQHGGGVYITASDYVYFYDNVIYGNTAEAYVAAAAGGGIYCSYCSPTFSGDIIRNNDATLGGGFYGLETQAEFSNVSIRDNNADSGAGVHCSQYSGLNFDIVSLKNNIASVSGGGLYCEESSPEFHHVLVVENEAGQYGGGLFVTGINSSPDFYNVTLSDNNATDNGGGMYVSSTSEYLFFNSIFWGNTPDQIYSSTRDGEINYSNIQGGWAGTGNIDVDPNYLDPAGDNYHLSPFNMANDSKNPLIDSGTPYNVQLPYTYFDEEPDPNGSWINMGAFGGTDQAAISITFADGNVDGDQEWESDEMQVVTEDVVIFPDVTLTVQPGAFIDIQDPTIGFEINGSIILDGDEQNPIKFGPDLSGGGRVDTWEGITFTGSANTASLIDYVIIENALNGVDLGEHSIDITHTQILYDSPTREVSDGTGIVVGGDSDPVINDCDVENYSKGIETKNSSTPTITNSRVRNNPESTRQDEIGIEITESASPTIDNCEIDHFPTGIKIENTTRTISTPTLTNSRVRNSPESTRDNEIGIHISGPVEMTIDNADIEDYPYGIRYLGTGRQIGRTTPTLTNSRVRNNPESSREVILKTGIYIEDLLAVEIDSCDINYYNTAIDIRNDVGRATSTPTLTNSRVRNAPESTREDKIGLRLTGDIYATVDYSEFVNCDSALIIIGADTHADIHHNLIYMIDLSAIDTAIDAHFSTNLNIWNNTIYDYTYGFVAENVIAHLYNNIIWNTDNPIENLGSTLNVDFNDIVGGFGRANIDADPMFIDTADENFNLMGGSPCIDAGDPTAPNDPDNTVSDIGRFYFHQQPTPVVLSSFSAAIIDASPILYWTTQSETDNLGWNVYRSESEIIEQSDQINQQMISGAGTTTEPTDYEFTDGYEVVPTNTYWYWLESVNSSSQTDIYGPIELTIPEDIEPEEFPEHTALIGNFPNPFHSNNDPTTIFFAIREGEIGNLTIFNIKGQQVENVQFEPGNRNYKWNSTGYSSGIYFYKLETENYKAVKKMLLLK